MKKNYLLLSLPLLLLTSCNLNEPSSSVEETQSIEPSTNVELDELLFDDVLINKDMGGYEVYNLLSKDDKESFFDISQFNYEMDFISKDETINLSSKGLYAKDNLTTTLGVKDINYLTSETINNLSNDNVYKYYKFSNSTRLNEPINSTVIARSMGDAYLLNDDIKAMMAQVFDESGKANNYVSDTIPSQLQVSDMTHEYFFFERANDFVIDDLYDNCFNDKYKEYHSYDFKLYNDYIKLNISNVYGIDIIGPVLFNSLLEKGFYFNCEIHVSTTSKQVEYISFELKSDYICNGIYQGILKTSLTKTNYSSEELDEMVNQKIEFVKNNI